MPKNWTIYAIRAAVRCATFYLALAGVQYMFDGKVAWAPNIFPAVGFSILLTYMQARWAYLRQRTKGSPRER